MTQYEGHPITLLTECLSHLGAISLPEIMLPASTFAEANRERVAFGIRYYCYSSIAQYRSVLAGVVASADSGNWACVNILTRHLMEWAAHATFAKLKLESLTRQERWDKAWDVLLKLNGGDLYFRQFGVKYLSESEKKIKIPEPYALANILGVYDSVCAKLDGQGAAKEDHSLLSELSHASAACLRQQHCLRGNNLVFIQNEEHSFLYLANATTIDWILCTASLLKVICDEVVGAPIVSAIKCMTGQ